METGKILVVDNERPIGQLYRRVLEKEGYIVTVCDNGDDALQRVCEEFFDVILLDLGIVGFDGRAFMRRVKRLSPGSRIIVASGYVTLDIIVSTFRIGAHDFLPKPFDINDLKRRVRHCFAFENIKN